MNLNLNPSVVTLGRAYKKTWSHQDDVDAFQPFSCKKTPHDFRSWQFSYNILCIFSEPWTIFWQNSSGPPDTWCYWCPWKLGAWTPCLGGALQATRGTFFFGASNQDWGIRYIRGVMGRIRGCGTLPEKQLKVYKAPLKCPCKGAMWWIWGPWGWRFP